MKTQIRMIVASAIVIALALTAVSGITYSWFSDTQTTDISVSTATVGLYVSIDETKVENKTEDVGTKVNFSYFTDDEGNPLIIDNDGNKAMDVSSFGISKLCADSYIKIPYTVSYKSDIKTVSRVTAELDITKTNLDDLYDDFKNIIITVGSTSKTFYDIANAAIISYLDGGKSTASIDLLSWTVNEPTDEYKDLLSDNYLIISTTTDFDAQGLIFTIKLKSEIYQSNYLTTYDTNSNEAYDVPDNKMVVFKNITISDDTSTETENVTFTDVLLDFSATDDVTKFYFPSSLVKLYDGIPGMTITALDTDNNQVSNGNVTISFNYDGNASNLSVFKDSEETSTNITDDAVITKECSDEGSYLRLKLPLNHLIYLNLTGLSDNSEKGADGSSVTGE